MDVASAWLPARMSEVERRLAQVAGGHGPELGEEAEATLDAGGKRLRPLLVLISAGSSASDRAVRAAVAIELIHMATLVHDDVLDGAPVRRGRPTVVARAGRGLLGWRRFHSGDSSSRLRFATCRSDSRRSVRAAIGFNMRTSVPSPSDSADIENLQPDSVASN